VHLRGGDAAVVTGAGSGIGLAIAMVLAARGCRLALVDVREDRLDAAKALLSTFVPAVSSHSADVSDQQALERVAEEVRGEHGSAALLVNSAGVALAGPFANTDPEAFDWVMRVNFGGTVRCCRAFLPQLRAAGRGHIVNIGSCFGWIGFPGKSGYCASKFAVRGFSEALRSELRAAGIGVTVVYPGIVGTNLVLDGRATDAFAQREEAEFLARQGLSAERVAKRVVRGVERDTARIIVGFEYRLIDVLVRLAPSWAPSLLARFGPRVSSSERPAWQ